MPMAYALAVPMPQISSTLSTTDVTTSSSYCGTAPKASPQSEMQLAVPLSDVDLPSDWTLGERELHDLEMLLSGAFAPLRGFMTSKEFVSVVQNARLTSGEVWPMPIVLPIPKAAIPSSDFKHLPPGVLIDAGPKPGIGGHYHPHPASCPTGAKKAESVRLRAPSNEKPRPGDSETATKCEVMKLRNSVGTVVAEMVVEDCYVPDLYKMMEYVLGTTDKNHPYVKVLESDHIGCVYVGGVVRAVHPIQHFDFNEFRLSPAATRALFKERGYTSVVGFQTRNPLHRSHFELTKKALRDVRETTGADASTVHLLLTPACGPTQVGDVEYYVRVRCYRKILPFYKEQSVTLVLLPLAMRMAGPREALWHALIRRNYGCTHFIIGREHASPSTRKKNGEPFYGPYDAHEFVAKFAEEIGITPVFGTNMVYVPNDSDPDVESCSSPAGGTYMQEAEVPAEKQARFLSGTKFREMLHNQEEIPSWFSFEPVVRELQSFYLPRHALGFCVYLTGLPCSGKSTLATALEAILRERETELRKVSVLDADIIRTHLTKGLGFNRADRQVNVRRIGYVASEIVKHKGICIVANIAPYEEDREYNRTLITCTGGGYIEVHVATPLAVCEERDVKQLYRKARQGLIPQFTGISDPYEAPKNAEIVIDSSANLDACVDDLLEYLTTNGWVLP